MWTLMVVLVKWWLNNQYLSLDQGCTQTDWQTDITIPRTMFILCGFSSISNPLAPSFTVELLKGWIGIIGVRESLFHNQAQN